MLRPGGVEFFVVLFVVGFLKEDIGANASFVQAAVVFYGGCGNVHIDTADGAVFMFDGINGMNAVEDVFDGVIYRVFTGFDSQPFVTHIL
jgi:hypothetical protein